MRRTLRSGFPIRMSVESIRRVLTIVWEMVITWFDWFRCRSQWCQREIGVKCEMKMRHLLKDWCDAHAYTGNVWFQSARAFRRVYSRNWKFTVHYDIQLTVKRLRLAPLERERETKKNGTFSHIDMRTLLSEDRMYVRICLAHTDLAATVAFHRKNLDHTPAPGTTQAFRYLGHGCLGRSRNCVERPS